MKYKLIFTDLVSLKIEDKLDANFGDMTMPYNSWHGNMLLASDWIRAFSNVISSITRYGPDYIDENKNIIEIPEIGYLLCYENISDDVTTIDIVNIAFRNSGRFKHMFESSSLISYILDTH